MKRPKLKRVNRPARKPSLLARIVEFFESNPDEELTPKDAAIKFSVPKSSAENTLSLLRKQGFVESTFVIRMTPEAKARCRTAPEPRPSDPEVPVFLDQKPGSDV